MTSPIEYIDVIARNLRIREYQYGNDDPTPEQKSFSAELGHLAEQMEKSAQFFRDQDETLPPRREFDPVHMLFYNGNIEWKGVGQ